MEMYPFSISRVGSMIQIDLKFNKPLKAGEGGCSRARGQKVEGLDMEKGDESAVHIFEIKTVTAFIYRRISITMRSWTSHQDERQAETFHV
jgi:hypothetical protein